MYDFLRLEEYEEMDENFKVSAKEGRAFLKQTYEACTGFRANFYAEDYEFVFPECCMEKCSCKPRNNSEE